MPDEPNKGKKTIAVVAVVLLGAAVAGWLVFKSRHAKTPNMPPIAALRLDSLDETNRVATLSDNGSQDPDGTLQSWRIAWGDGKEDNLASIPQKATHTYGSEGEYTISLWCVDNNGATSSPPATINVTLDLQKRQKALEQTQAEAKRQADAKREADRLKEEQAKKEADRLEQERQKEMAARKAREQQALEEKRKADAELARQKAKEKTPTQPPPTPLAAALPDASSSRRIIFTPSGSTHAEFQINKEKTEKKEPNGNLPVVLVIRCVNFPDTPITTSNWQIDGKDYKLQAGRIRASLSPGQHDVAALVTRKAGQAPAEIKAHVTVRTNGDCVVEPRK